MNPEDLKNIWSQQTGPADGTVTVNAELIWRLASESARFKRTIFWRDVREWAATIVIAVTFLYAAFANRDHVDWPMIAAALFACVPMSYVAFRHPKRRAPESNTRLIDHLREAIAEVQLQRDLLRSVARWYLSPLALSCAIVLVDVVLKAPLPARARLFLIAPIAIQAVVMAAIFYAVWKLNQFAVRKHLEPRLQQLKQTLAEMEKE